MAQAGRTGKEGGREAGRAEASREAGREGGTGGSREGWMDESDSYLCLINIWRM